MKEEVKVLPKAAFKEPKLTLKESKMEGMSPKGGGTGTAGGGGGGGPAECKALGKRPATVESPKPSAKKQKKGSSEGPKGATGGAFTGTSPRVSSSSAVSQAYPDKKPPKGDKGRWAKGKNDTQEPKEPKKLAESEESNSEEEASSKSEVFQTNACLSWRHNGATTQRPRQHLSADKTHSVVLNARKSISLIFFFCGFAQQSAPSSPSNSSSSSDSSSDSDFEPGQKPGQGRVSSSSSDKQNLVGLFLELWLLKSCRPPPPRSSSLYGGGDPVRRVG